jgi:hypothetical protein
MRHKLIVLLCCMVFAFCAATPAASGQQQPDVRRLKPNSWTKPAGDIDIEKIKRDLETSGLSPDSPLPLWLFNVESSRDDNDYTGVMVGASPFSDRGNKNISVGSYVVPLIIVTNSIATAVDFTTGQITTVPGVTTFDPSAANACLSAPNNIPTELFKESPIFKPASFDFGGADMGKTQYVDAFQRGNFWTALGDHGIRHDYHVRLDPVRFLDPIVINVPAASGLAGIDPLLFGPPPYCPPFGIIDNQWLDAYLVSTILPALTRQGVDPSNFPMFLLSNVVMASPVTNWFTCCTIGYHAWTGLPIQTYAVADFDSSGYFISPGNLAINDTGIWSHEVAEWMNDPFGNNPVPAWGHIGQQPGCQTNLEVGDPLTGTAFPAVVMDNGFTYHLQELAFFSWFFGAPSIGANGWFSDNGTFLTDAGPPCQ